LVIHFSLVILPVLWAVSMMLMLLCTPSLFPVLVFYTNSTSSVTNILSDLRMSPLPPPPRAPGTRIFSQSFFLCMATIVPAPASAPRLESSNGQIACICPNLNLLPGGGGGYRVRMYAPAPDLHLLQKIGSQCTPAQHLYLLPRFRVIICTCPNLHLLLGLGVIKGQNVCKYPGPAFASRIRVRMCTSSAPGSTSKVQGRNMHLPRV
jgi:hypothetical protein